QNYERIYKNQSDNWNMAEGMPGAHYQQQMYAQPVFSYYTYAPVLPAGRLPAALSYSLGWFSGLIMLFFGWQNRFVRFHALQSLFFFGAVNIFDIAILRALFPIWHHSHVLSLAFIGLFLLINTIAAIAWILGMVQAGLGKYYQLPVVGEAIMRKFVAQPPIK
ncbi:MAG TPA: hypothetical protein VGN34_23670, partial [Ktedonobacteraceae bacterium]